MPVTLYDGFSLLQICPKRRWRLGTEPREREREREYFRLAFIALSRRIRGTANERGLKRRQPIKNARRSWVVWHEGGEIWWHPVPLAHSQPLAFAASTTGVKEIVITLFRDRNPVLVSRHICATYVWICRFGTERHHLWREGVYSACLYCLIVYNERDSRSFGQSVSFAVATTEVEGIVITLFRDMSVPRTHLLPPFTDIPYHFSFSFGIKVCPPSNQKHNNLCIKKERAVWKMISILDCALKDIIHVRNIGYCYVCFVIFVCTLSEFESLAPNT